MMTVVSKYSSEDRLRVYDDSELGVLWSMVQCFAKILRCRKRSSVHMHGFCSILMFIEDYKKSYRHNES